MPKPVSVGQFEQAVMTAVLALGENAYGVTIHAKTEELAGGKSVALGAVYATLDRLEDKGLITSHLSDPTPERGGRAKRYYRLEATGSQALHESALMSKRICDTIETSWGESVWKPGKWKLARQP